MDIKNKVLRRQYTAHKGEDLISQVAKVLCIVTPGGFVSAGLHPSGEVIMVNCCQISGVVLDAQLMQYELESEPLLAQQALIKALFVVTSNNTLIPAALYDNKESALALLSSTHFCDAQDALDCVLEDRSQIFTAFSYSDSIHQALGGLASNVKLLPLNIVHLNNGHAVDQLLQCTLSEREAIGSLHINKKLVWHQTFAYQTEEDVLFQLASACRHFGIEARNVPVHINTTSIELHPLMKRLVLHFEQEQSLKSNISDILSPEWSSTIRLIQQLNACVS